MKSGLESILEMLGNVVQVIQEAEDKRSSDQEAVLDKLSSDQEAVLRGISELDSNNEQSMDLVQGFKDSFVNWKQENTNDRARNHNMVWKELQKINNAVKR